MQAQYLLNDRQADQLMAEFNKVVNGLVIDGYDLSGALRYPFFVDCLRTHSYQRYCVTNPRYWFSPTGWKYEYVPANVLFAQEGTSEREKEQIVPLMNWLLSHECSAGVVRQSPDGRLKRLWISIESCLEQRSWLCGLETSLDRVDDMACFLGKEFGLTEEFRDWLRIETALALARHKRALAILERTVPRAKGVVVFSEYHPISRAILNAARRLDIPTILIQHGFLGQEWLHWPISSEKVCLWGEVDKRWYVNRGLPVNRIEVTGSHRASSIDSSYRSAVRTNYDVRKNERVIVFFAPNLVRQYHAQAAEFLIAVRSSLSSPCRWFVRPHPSQSLGEGMDEYRGLEAIPSSVPLKEVFALADLVLHDHSTMAFAQFAGIKTACLALDPPYPKYYPLLLGAQGLITSVEQLCVLIRELSPSYDLVSQPTVTMAAGGQDALERVGQVILDVSSTRAV